MIKAFRENCRITDVVTWLTAFGIFLKQFYLLPSGTLQLGDMVLLLAAGLCALACGMQFHKMDAPLYLFVLLACVVNAIQSLINHSFISDSFFLIYNVLILAFLFRPMLQEEGFLDALQFVFRLVLILQLLFLITGVGVMELRRYRGTFNDPNQFGFYIFSAFMGQYAISIIKRKKQCILWFLITFWLIIASGSTGMTLGLCIFAAGWLIIGKDDDGLTRKRLVWILFVCAVLAALVFFLIHLMDKAEDGDLFILRRNRYRLYAKGGIFSEFLSDRGLERVIRWPENFLYGSGEGIWERFPLFSLEEPYWYIEIHSTVVTLAFSYGIIPYTILIIWVVRNLRRIRKGLVCMYISLFAEACVLVNHRQPLFWFLILLASHEGAKREKEMLPNLSGNRNRIPGRKKAG